MEKAMAPHSSTLAWKIPWMEEPSRLQSVGLLRVGHGWATSPWLFTLCIGEGNGNPLQCSCLENPRDGVAWWAAVYGVAQSRTWLKRLSSSSSHVWLFATPWTIQSMEFSRPNTGVGNLSLLQQIFPTKEWNQGLLRCRQILYQLSHKRSLRKRDSSLSHYTDSVAFSVVRNIC